MACSFQGTLFPCGPDPASHPTVTHCIPLALCRPGNDITNHLKLWHINPDDLNSEADLLLARGGFFDEPVIASFTVCPNHRARLGLGWKHNCSR